LTFFGGGGGGGGDLGADIHECAVKVKIFLKLEQVKKALEFNICLLLTYKYYISKTCQMLFLHFPMKYCMNLYKSIASAAQFFSSNMVGSGSVDQSDLDSQC
jgi:hypothetical protein